MEIFIVTYAKDAEWLKWCLKSIDKFSNGFQGITIMVPSKDYDSIRPALDVRDNSGPVTVVRLFDETKDKGMLHHMALNCMADQFAEADYFLHMDSDCIFIEPVTPDDYFNDGKPILLKEEYANFRTKHPGVYYWKECSEKALGWKCNWETMRRHPSVHPRATYEATRKAVEDNVKRPFLEWALDGRNEFPQFWSEFNLLGAVAHQIFYDQYHWIDVGNEPWPKDKLCQFWSHGDLDRLKDTEPFMGETPRAIIERLLE